MTTEQDKYRDEVQRWAIEQVVRLHGDSGLTIEAVLSEARKLVDFVLKPEPTPEPELEVESAGEESD